MSAGRRGAYFVAALGVFWAGLTLMGLLLDAELPDNAFVRAALLPTCIILTFGGTVGAVLLFMLAVDEDAFR